MPIQWKRPESVPFPSEWSRFDGKREINGKIPKFWIQDIPEHMFNEAAAMMCKTFIYGEPLCKFSNLADDEVSCSDLYELWKKLAREKLGLVCFMENPDPNGKPIVAGMNMTYPTAKGDPTPEFKGPKWRKVLDTVTYVCKHRDQYSMLGIDKYLNARGMAVYHEFRGQGIGDEFLKARIPLCKAVGLPATLTVFTAIASQTIAVRNGYKDIFSMPYAELEQISPRFSFPGITEHTKSMRFMYKMIE